MILVACWGGNVRSVHAAFLLKHVFHYKDVVTIGLGTTEAPLLDTLCAMADTILVVGDDELPPIIPTEYRSKMKHLNVGLDKWGWTGYKELENMLYDKLTQEGYTHQ